MLLNNEIRERKYKRKITLFKKALNNKPEKDWIIDRMNQPVGINIELYHQSVDLFKTNVSFLIRSSGFHANEFFYHLNQAGIKTSVKHLKVETRTRIRGYLNMLIIVTFARIFDIDPEVLISVNLPDEYYSNHPDDAPDWWRGQHPEFYEGG